MWSTTAATTTTCTRKAWSNGLLALLVPLTLAGCTQDAASYVLGDKDHAITLTRNADWFWQGTLSVDVAAIRLPECQGGGRVAAVPHDAEFILYKAPDQYPEPIFILGVDQRLYAVSTASCRMQAFTEAPPDLGVELGRFTARGGGFRFEALAAPAAQDG